MKTRTYNKYQVSVGLRLYEARRAKGWTLQQLAEKTGASPQALCSYEAGKRVPQIERLRDLCAVLEMSADWVLGLK